MVTFDLDRLRKLASHGYVSSPYVEQAIEEIERLRAEARDISDALRYCLTGAEITGCPSPGLMDDALERLERLGQEGAVTQ